MTPAPFNTLPGDPVPRVRAFWLRSEDGVRLRAAHWPSDVGLGTVFLFQGRSEYLEKYNAVALELNEAGYDVLSIDWRGQGLSDRLQEDPRPSYIHDFAEYQRDVLELVVAADTLDLPQPWHLLAHSMGGTIGYTSLISEMPVASAVFSAPMWGINFGPVPRFVVAALASSGNRLGRGGRICPGSGNDTSFTLRSSFQKNPLTADGVRWGRMVAEANSWPEVTLGGVSNEWLMAAMRECDHILAMPLPVQPTLIGIGQTDRVVSIPAIRRRLEGWHDCELVELTGSKHEPLMERAPIRRQFINATIRHFRSVG
ncbi:alpha/beta hydrolase [Paracoccus aminophilus]|uniref:Lysophospholipase n=1 Tax=Paracoccus aminophilus JCM 7686 TaxID=1367847 RepID=S5XMA0_PARAH|nr:alpha/beta hydrolase [Paracoccus aminophilus]AGT08434.1 lysophospholipase [Paracoccus aminophilus JCM 7686]